MINMTECGRVATTEGRPAFQGGFWFITQISGRVELVNVFVGQRFRSRFLVANRRGSFFRLNVLARSDVLGCVSGV